MNIFKNIKVKRFLYLQIHSFLININFSFFFLCTKLITPISLSLILSFFLYQDNFSNSFFYIYIGVICFQFFSELVSSGSKLTYNQLEKNMNIFNIKYYVSFFFIVFEKVIYLFIHLFLIFILNVYFDVFVSNTKTFSTIFLIIFLYSMIGINLLILGFIYRIFLKNYIFLLDLILRMLFFASPVIWFPNNNSAKKIFLDYNPLAELICMLRRVFDLSYYENVSFLNITFIVISFFILPVFIKFRRVLLNAR
jgi:ABC-type polysaccharide/polyol phosphate export permease